LAERGTGRLITAAHFPGALVAAKDRGYSCFQHSTFLLKKSETRMAADFIMTKHNMPIFGVIFTA